MKRSLTHLPAHKRHELHTIKDIILEVIPQTAMIILFGSYARGASICLNLAKAEMYL